MLKELKNFLKTRTPFLANMLRVCRHFAISVFRKAGYITRYFEKDPLVIIWIDGGFCSQIFRYLKGRWYANRGFRVKYDISWYDDDPRDCSGIERRDFILPECFNHIEFEVASPGELMKYRFLYGKSTHTAALYKSNGYYSKLQAPLYDFLYALDWVISTENEFEELAQCLQWYKLHDILNEEAKIIEASIIQNKKDNVKTIGLHVRRGDMISSKFAYGHKVLTSKYYEHVLNLAYDVNSVIYIFSNGFDFVTSSVVPHIKGRYILADKTSSVYEDMFLCSLCDVQVAGQGSMGSMAYSFNMNKDRKLIRPFILEHDEERLPKYYAGSYGTVKFVHLMEDMYEQ